QVCHGVGASQACALGSTWELALGLSPEIFRFAHFWAAPGAALPRSVDKTAVAFPHQLML
ncbi:MAG: hypothetical protein ACK5V9_10585, partial [Burkholderiales bacterium]